MIWDQGWKNRWRERLFFHQPSTEVLISEDQEFLNYDKFEV
jgi:hypothetical protein